MIFVTVGTHEQQFDRLVSTVDKLKGNGNIEEEVVIQTGFSTYEPKYCKWQKLYSYSDMNKLADNARIMITHGGPSSFIMALQRGKIPIVVPRQSRFDEHVNDHQVRFCEAVKERYGNIIVVEDINELMNTIQTYDLVTSGMIGKISAIGNNKRFVTGFEKLADELINNKKSKPSFHKSREK